MKGPGQRRPLGKAAGQAFAGQQTLNPKVQGSIPWRSTLWLATHP